MDLITKLNLGSTAEIAIIVIIVYGLTQAVKQTKIDNRFMPWISMILGIFSGLISVFITNDHNFSGACFLGFLIGGFTSGLYDGFSGFVKKATEDAKQILELNKQDQGRNLQGKEIPDDQNKEESK